jgi:hypothetical protein
VSSGATTCVLCISVGRFHECFKVVLGVVVVAFDDGGLLLLILHFTLFEVVAVVHLLEVKLQFVLVGDGDVGADEGALVVIQALAERGEMFIAIPFCVVRVFQCILGLDVEWAPTIVEMLQDLEGVTF